MCIVPKQEPSQTCTTPHCDLLCPMSLYWIAFANNTWRKLALQKGIKRHRVGGSIQNLHVEQAGGSVTSCLN